MLQYHRIEQDVWRQNRALRWLFCISLASFLVCLTALAFDYREINGELAWIKPLKFSVSFATYAISMIWLSQFVVQWRNVFRWAANAACFGAVTELGAIILQVMRGTTSHFNTGTTFDHAIFIIVKVSILPVAFALLVSLFLLKKQKSLPPVIDSALHWGVFLTLVGCLPAILMVLPDPLQDAITRYAALNGHTVGLAEGGPGLPFLGWSTVAGDLRVAHFVGIHALQILPMAGVLIVRYFANLSNQRQSLLVANLGVTYLFVIGLLTFEAMHAESLFAPSLQTIISFAFLFSASAVASCITIMFPIAAQSRTSASFGVETII